MIHLGQSRAFSGVTLAAIVATACSGRVEREHPEPSGGAGAPVARVPGNSSIDDPSDGPSVGGRANSPSSGGVSGTWTAAGGAPVGVAGGAPVGVGAAGGAPIAGAPGCVASWAGAGAGGAWAGGLGSGGFGAACVPPVAANQVPLTPVDGWVDGASNPLAIQGALYAAADPRSVVSSDFMGSNVCMKGVTAKVDPNCTPIPPAADCQMTIWGAAIYLNLNQPLDPSTMMPGAPVTFDARKLGGFAFELSGPNVPKPSDLRFTVETQLYQDQTTIIDFCSGWDKQLTPGDNTVKFGEIFPQCFFLPHNQSSLGGDILAVVRRLEWQVLTNSGAEVPYDFCVSNIRAIYK